MRTRALLGLSAALGVVGVCSSGDLGAASIRNPSFQTPSRNIICDGDIADVRHTFMECGIKSGLVGARAPRRCAPGDPQGSRVYVPALGNGGRVLCAGDPGPFLYVHAPVLRYGQAWRGGGITCVSARSGLKCTNRGGHGFFLSRQRWRVF